MPRHAALLAVLACVSLGCTMHHTSRYDLYPDGTVGFTRVSRSSRNLAHGTEAVIVTAYRCKRALVGEGETVHALTLSPNDVTFGKGDTPYPYKITDCVVESEAMSNGSTLTGTFVGGVTGSAGTAVGGFFVGKGIQKARPDMTNVSQDQDGASATGGAGGMATGASATATGGSSSAASSATGGSSTVGNVAGGAGGAGGVATVGNVQSASTSTSTGNRNTVGNTTNSSRNESISRQARRR